MASGVRLDIRQAGRHVAFALGVLAALEVGFWGLVTRPKVREYTALSVGTGPQQDELRARRAGVESAERFLAALEATQSDLARLRGELLGTREERMIDVHLELASLCERFGIDLDQVTFGNSILEDEELDKMIMTVPLEGGYANLRRFLQAVESSEKFLVVEQVALSEAKLGGVLLELSITLASYFDAPDVRAGRESERARQRGAAERGG